MRYLLPLHQDDRFELYSTDELTAEWISLVRRLSALIVATEGDPRDAYGFAVTASVHVPIVMLTPRRFAQHHGLMVQAGAAASLSMPLKPRDLDRLLPLLRSQATTSRVDGSLRLLLDPVNREVRLASKRIRLTPTEYSLLHCLSTHHGRPVEASDILDTVWPTADGRRSRGLLDIYVLKVRKKLSCIGLTDAVTTVRGFGYALVLPTRLPDIESAAPPLATAEFGQYS